MSNVEKSTEDSTSPKGEDDAMRKHKTRVRRRIVFGVLIFLAVSGCVLSVINTRNATEQQERYVPFACGADETFIKESSKAMISGKKEDLVQYFDKAKTMANNENEQNCQYLNLKYYIAGGDLYNAKSTYDKFLVMYSKEKDAYLALNARFETNEELKISINNLEQIDSFMSENAKKWMR